MPQTPLEITNFFLAMQSGPPGMGRLMALFSEDAEYTEPFSGQPTTHKGPKAISEAFTASRSEAFNDAVIALNSVEMEDETIRVRWTCFSQAIPGGQGSGTNVFTLRDGKITELVTTLDMPG